MHPNKIINHNTDELHVRVETAHTCLSALWDNLRIPLTGSEWNEAEELVHALRKVIDAAGAALPPKVDPIRAAKADAWREGLMVGFTEGQKDAGGEDYADTKNPYKD
jgi:ferric-dicitrate binding protein FerR (iron transport regulator)